MKKRVWAESIGPLFYLRAYMIMGLSMIVPVGSNYGSSCFIGYLLDHGIWKQPLTWAGILSCRAIILIYILFHRLISRFIVINSLTL